MKHSEKTKKKISMTKKGIPRSHEEKRKISEGRLKRYGGKSKHSKGYILLFRPTHPFAWKTGYVRQTRMVMEELLRKNNPNHPALIKREGKLYLKPEWDVHHINEKKDDDRPGNLKVLKHNEHSKLNFPKNKGTGHYIWKKPLTNHPFICQNGCIKRSRLSIEQWLREHQPDHPSLVKINGIKYLQNGWIVHHINGKKDDDRPKNLEAMTRREHGQLFWRNGT